MGGRSLVKRRSLNDIAVRSLIGSSRRGPGLMFVGSVEPAQQDRVEVVGELYAVDRSLKLRGAGRADQIGRDDDHELGLAGLVVSRAEEGAEDRHILHARQGVEVLL